MRLEKSSRLHANKESNKLVLEREFSLQLTTILIELEADYFISSISQTSLAN